MKKLDKLILSSFIGPFILTFLVVVFILLTQHMLKYFDDIVGKDIGIGVLANLMFDFSIFMTPIAIPLAVLLSSLMTFGNLGEHFELTAVKSAGISLVRTLLPIFVFVIGLTVLAFYSNNYFVPKAALNAYSLLYDIKQKKPTLDLKEGAFYNGIPDLSIKVSKKEAKSGKIWDAIIYDHRDKTGNKKVTLADSGRMYTIFNDQYLVLELYSGHTYIEGQANAKSVSSKGARTKAESLSRVQFDKSKIVLDLSSFGMTRTDQSLFSGNRIMRNLSELRGDMDSLDQDVLEHELSAFKATKSSFKYLDKDRLPLVKKLVELQSLKDSTAEENVKRRKKEFIKQDSIDSKYLPANPDSVVTDKASVQKAPTVIGKSNKTGAKSKMPRKIKKQGLKKQRNNVLNSKKIKVNSNLTTKLADEKKKERNAEAERKEKLNEFISDTNTSHKVLKTTVNRVRQLKSKIQNTATRIEDTIISGYVFKVQWHKIVSNSFACLVMFLIGAPLGAIIKKGGLGFPVLISIFFFIVFYVLGMVGEKQAKAGFIDPLVGVWLANMILLPFGLFFLRQARNDARLFEADFYNVAVDKIKTYFRNRK